jgi:hypothetical protein
MKIIFTTFILPYEIDDLERILIGLKKASKFVDGNNYQFNVSIGISDYLVNWENSKISKEFFIEKFNSLKLLTDWTTNSIFQIREDVLGCVSSRRTAHLEVPDATHFVWLDTDIVFEEQILFYLENAIIGIEEEGIDEYILTPEIVKMWDNTWDCLVNKNYLDKPINYHKTNDPYMDCGVYGDITLELVKNNVSGQPSTKFTGGWFTCISKKLLDITGIPESFGHYGVEDAFIMWVIDRLNKNGKNIYQFKLVNYIVCEDYIYRNRDYYLNNIKLINRKDEFRKIAESNFNNELNKF